ncbi:hypothetical protein ACKFKG_26490 [Phormidesmis sp. 146-35]
MLGTKLEETRVYREAQEEKAMAIALNMMQHGFPIDKISQLTKLTIEQLQHFQSQQN